MDQERRPDRYSFTSDTPEFYRWYEHGGKARSKPLTLEGMEKFYLEKGYAPETARAAAWSSGARPEEAKKNDKAPSLDQEENSIESTHKKDQVRTADDDARKFLERRKPLTAKTEVEQSAKMDKQQAEPGQDIEPKNVFSDLDKKNPLVPAHIQKQYLKVGSRYFYEANPDQLAFEDKGNKLKSKSSGVKVSGALVDIAEARGWTEIKARGSEDFRRNVWLDASARGIDVRGYQPKEADLALLEKRVQNKQTSSHSSKQQGKTLAQEKAAAILKKKPEELVKAHPEMKHEAATLKLAEKVAARFPNKSDQQRFLAQVQDRVAFKVEKGLPGAKVKVREVRQVQAVKEERVQGR